MAMLSVFCEPFRSKMIKEIYKSPCNNNSSRVDFSSVPPVLTGHLKCQAVSSLPINCHPMITIMNEYHVSLHQSKSSYKNREDTDSFAFKVDQMTFGTLFSIVDTL